MFNFRKDILVKVQGHKMYANTLDRIAALFLWKFSMLENFETELVKDIVKEGMNVLDIGANIGYYTLQFARLVRNKGKVYAFEPEINNYSLLVRNVNSNSYKNVIAIQKAVADKSKKVNLFLNKIHKGDHRIFDSGDGRKQVEVEAVAVDDIFTDNCYIDFIKMDIQGAEYLALSGMERLIKRQDKLKVICEFSPDLLKQCGFSGEQFIKKTRELGFKIRFINEKNKCIESVEDHNLILISKRYGYVNLYLEKYSK